VQKESDARPIPRILRIRSGFSASGAADCAPSNQPPFRRLLLSAATRTAVWRFCSGVRIRAAARRFSRARPHSGEQVCDVAVSGESPLASRFACASSTEQSHSPTTPLVLDGVAIPGACAEALTMEPSLTFSPTHFGDRHKRGVITVVWRRTVVGADRTVRFQISASRSAGQLPCARARPQGGSLASAAILPSPTACARRATPRIACRCLV
jgi:hypothetical protein